MYKPEYDEYVYYPRNNTAVGCITLSISYTLQSTFKGIKAANTLWLKIEELYGGTEDVRIAYHLKVLTNIKYNDLGSVEKLVQQFEDTRQNLEMYESDSERMPPKYYILLFLQALESSLFKE